MTKTQGTHSVLYVDFFARRDNHLYDDDFFLSKCIAPLAKDFVAVTSTESALNIKRNLQIETWSTSQIDPTLYLQRFRLFRLAFHLQSKRFQHIIFQSFEEVSVLFFILMNPNKRIHLIVTSNLRSDRIKRHPILLRIFLSMIFKRAASVLVHSQFEVDRILNFIPGVDATKIFIKPYHKIAAPRVQIQWNDKSQTILFVGPELNFKTTQPLIELIKNDSEHRFHYTLCSMNDKHMIPEKKAFFDKHENVEILFGHLQEEQYYHMVSQAALVIMTHDDGYEGALSGVFCDAIASGTPVIVRNMAPYSEFFTRFGPIGFLVDYNEPDWHKLILTADLEKFYNIFQKNMAVCRESCTMESVRKVFQTILK